MIHHIEINSNLNASKIRNNHLLNSFWFLRAHLTRALWLSLLLNHLSLPQNRIKQFKKNGGLNLEFLEGPLAQAFVCTFQELKLATFQTRKAAVSSVPDFLFFRIQKKSKAFLCSLYAISNAKRVLNAVNITLIRYEHTPFKNHRLKPLIRNNVRSFT